MIGRKASFAVAATAATLLLLAGCATSPYGYGNRQPYTNTIHGTVDYVDANSRTIALYDTNGYGTMLSGGGYGGNGGSVRVYYDRNTMVYWQGRSYRPEDLERGDQVDVTVHQSGNSLVAESANVTYNANNASNPYPNNNYPNQYPSTNGNSLLRGTVRYVDPNARTIQLDQNGSVVTVSYDNSARVDVNGQLLPVTNLERGDEIEVQAQSYGNRSTSLFATRITLIRDVRR
jgi:hypothetical protein